MNAAIYLRVSTTEQAENGFGLDAQREKCMAQAIVNDWDVVQEYVDDISGTKDESERPGLAAMLEAVCNGDIEAVIVAALDRLGRSTRLVLRIIDRLDACDAKIASCKESLDTSTPAGRFVMRMFASLAELDRDNIVQRTTEGRDARGRIDGERGGRVPMGYTRTEEGVEIVPDEAEIVRQIFSKRGASATLTVIADSLNKQGIKTRRGGKWHASSVRQILMNEDKYRGGFRWESEIRWPVILENE